MNKYVGNTYLVKNLPAEKDGMPVSLTGLFEVVEYSADEPDVNIREGFVLVPAGLPPDADVDDQAIDVDPYHLLVQIDPEFVAAERKWETEAEEAAEHGD